MPKLPTYTASTQPGVISGGRMATAEDFGAVDLSSAAAAVRKAGTAYIQDAEEGETRQVLVRQAEIRAKYAKRLDDAALSGEDIGKIREELDTELSTVSDGLTTRKAADAAALHTANTGAIFDSQANQIQVTRATLTARVEGAKFLNTTGAIVASNPTYLPQGEKDVDAFVATLSRVPPEKRAIIAEELKQGLNVAAAMANARIDPEGTKRAVEGGAYNITPEQRQQVIGRADAEVRAKRTDEAYKRAEAEYQERERDEKARDSLFKGIMAGTVRARDVLDNPDLRPGTREHLVVFIEQRAKALAGQERKSDTATFNALYQSIIAPDGTPGKIYNTDAVFEAVKAGKLNTTDAERLRGIVMGQKDVNGRTFATKLYGRVADIKAALRQDPVMSAQPELSEAVQQRVVTLAEQRSEELRKENKSPNEMFNPNSKDYFFTPALLKQATNDAKAARDAMLPKAVRVSSQAEYDALDPGTNYIDSAGRPGVKKGPAKTSAPAVAPENDLQDWMRATGGRLLPGQTQAQAIADWKAGR